MHISEPKVLDANQIDLEMKLMAQEQIFCRVEQGKVGRCDPPT